MTTAASHDPVLILLDLIRRSLYVRSAMLRLTNDDGSPVVVSVGAPIPDSCLSLAESLQELAATAPLLIPDLDVECDASGRSIDPCGLRLRFYAGIPLLGAGGLRIGVLSLFHTQPRLLSPIQRRKLEDLAAELEPVAVEALAEAVVRAVGQPFRLGDRDLDLGASVGIARVCDLADPAALFVGADMALYAAKAAGRGRFRVFDLAMAQAEPWRLARVDRSEVGWRHRRLSAKH